MVPHTFPSLLTSSKLHTLESKKKKTQLCQNNSILFNIERRWKKWIQITSALLFLGRGWERNLKKKGDQE